MRNVLIRSCCLIASCFLLVGCSGKPKGARTPPPAPQTPPTKAEAPAAPPTTAPAPSAAGQAATSAPKEATVAPRPQPSRQAGVAPPAPGPQTPPAPKLTLATAAEKSLGIPIYPGAKPETAAPLTNVGEFTQKLVLTTPDSMEKVEIYYTRTFPGAVVMGRGKVGDQPFENILLVSGKGEKRAFFYHPSGKKEVRIELTVGK
jgi:hypothetical protein